MHIPFVVFLLLLSGQLKPYGAQMIAIAIDSKAAFVPPIEGPLLAVNHHIARVVDVLHRTAPVLRDLLAPCVLNQ
jgi:hypothetical protein